MVSKGLTIVEKVNSMKLANIRMCN